MMRKIIFVNEECHHIFNRGVDKREVFLDAEDKARFLKSMQEFNRLDAIGSLYEESFREKNNLGVQLPRLVEIICYCLNPNHYHFVLKQLTDKGIEKFMQKLSTGYTNYFNKKYIRSGALFQGRYKSSHIDSNEYLLLVSAYVNCNSEVHKIAEADNYEWCSFPEYAGKIKHDLCDKEIILGQFDSPEGYFDFAKANALEMKNKKEAEKMLLE